MKNLRKQSGVLLGLLATIAAAYVSLDCFGKGSSEITATDVVGALTPNQGAVTTIVGDTVIVPAIDALGSDNRRLSFDLDWASDNPAVAALINTPTSKTSSSDHGGVFETRSKGTATITGTPTNAVKTVGGATLKYTMTVTVTGDPVSLKISPVSPVFMGITNGAPSSYLAPTVSIKNAEGLELNAGKFTVRWTLAAKGPLAFFDSASGLLFLEAQEDRPLSFVTGSSSPFRLSGYKPGAVRLTATLQPKTGHTFPSLADAIDVTVGGGSVSITGNNSAIELGDSPTFTAAVFNAVGARVANAAVVWSTSRPTSGTIDQTGKLTTLASSPDGDTLSIIARVPSLGTIGTLPIVIYRKVAAITLTPSPINITLGGVIRVSAHYSDASGNPITKYFVAPESFPVWTITGGPAVATINDVITTIESDTSRILVGALAGDATLRVSLRGIVATAPVHVAPVIASIALTVPSGPTTRPVVTTGEPVRIGSTLDLIATPKDAAGNTIAENVTFTASPSGIVTLSGTTTNRKTITAIAAGTANIVVTSSSNPNITATVPIIVTGAPSGGVATKIVMTAAPANAVAKVGGTVQFTAVAKDADGATASNCPVDYATDESAIGTVTSTGLATGVGLGATAVRAFCKDGGNLSAVAKFTVNEATYNVTQVNVTSRYFYLGSGGTAQSAATVTQTAGPTAPVQWFIDARPSPGIATINTTTGLITVPATTSGGGAVITAVSGGQSDIGWITYGNAGAVRGTVVSSSGRYLGGSTATATPTTGGATQTTSFSNDGNFYLVGLAPGSYTVIVTAQGLPGSQIFNNVVVSAAGVTFVAVAPFP
ncbi:MAG: carboxypeptidase regulatory-like domain-containing protein [Gemmatimonadaceae bacterium]